MEVVLAIICVLMIIGFIIYVVSSNLTERANVRREIAKKQQDEAQAEEYTKNLQEYQESHPMIYENEARRYRFGTRIKAVNKKIQAFEKISITIFSNQKHIRISVSMMNTIFKVCKSFTLIS